MSHQSCSDNEDAAGRCSHHRQIVTGKTGEGDNDVKIDMIAHESNEQNQDYDLYLTKSK